MFVREIKQLAFRRRVLTLTHPYTNTSLDAHVKCTPEFHQLLGLLVRSQYLRIKEILDVQFDYYLSLRRS